VAVTEWDPTVRLEVDRVATPPLRVPLPNEVAPSMNVTVPVPPDGETVAVKVTAWPEAEGFRLDVSPVVVPALFTVSETTPEVLPL
jgi:hypothetical protein